MPLAELSHVCTSNNEEALEDHRLEHSRVSINIGEEGVRALLSDVTFDPEEGLPASGLPFFFLLFCFLPLFLGEGLWGCVPLEMLRLPSPLTLGASASSFGGIFTPGWVEVFPIGAGDFLLWVT